MTKPANKIKTWLRSRIGIRTVIWSILCLGLSFIFFRGFWFSLPYMLSPNWVFGQNHASSWGILALCLAFLWMKRKSVYREITRSEKFEITGLKSALSVYLLNIELLLGGVLVAAAVLIPTSNDYKVFQVLLAWLGVFILVFGKEAAKIPSLLLSLYLFVISFPLAIARFAEEPYARSALIPLKALLNLLGYPLQDQGQMIRLLSSNGETISVIVSAACAGPTTIGVFIALFVLMMLDMPLPPKKAVWLFFVGIAGTWLQNVIRLTILMLTAYYLGREAMWTAHSWSIYVLFPIWYLLFVYIYFRQVKRPPATK